MKKIIITMLALALLCNIAFPVQAISEQYELPELGLSLEVPSKYDVFTRSMDENDPLFDIQTAKAEAEQPKRQAVNATAKKSPPQIICKTGAIYLHQRGRKSEINLLQ